MPLDGLRQASEARLRFVRRVSFNCMLCPTPLMAGGPCTRFLSPLEKPTVKDLPRNRVCQTPLQGPSRLQAHSPTQRVRTRIEGNMGSRLGAPDYAVVGGLLPGRRFQRVRGLESRRGFQSDRDVRGRPTREEGKGARHQGKPCWRFMKSASEKDGGLRSDVGRHASLCQSQESLGRSAGRVEGNRRRL